MEPWMFIIFYLFIAILASIGTNNKPPFKTEQVKEIWHNLTEDERKAANNKSLIYGVSLGAILGIVPCVFGFTFGIIFLGSALNGLIVGMLLFPIVVIVLRKKFLPYLTESWRDFFASTEWAKNNGLQPDDIRLFESAEE